MSNPFNYVDYAKEADWEKIYGESQDDCCYL